MMRLEVFRLATDMLQYLDPDGLDETVLNIGQIKTNLEGQISDLGESIEEELQNLSYARPDGLYPDMTVGAVIGADETAQWAQRESAGSGTAIVRSVQGAAVGWNQLNNNNGYASTTGVTVTNNNDGSWTLNGTETADGGIFITTASIPAKAGDKFLLRGCPAGGSATTYYMGLGDVLADTGSGGFQTIASDSNVALRLIIKAGASFDNVTIWPQAFNLTQMFGSGNEPTTIADFERMFPESYYPYSAPTLKPVQIAGIQSDVDSVYWPVQMLRAAGSIRDELTADEVVTHVGAVADASALRVNGFNTTNHYITLFLPTTGANTTSATPNVTCIGFTATPTLGDKHCYITSGGALILLCDNSWASRADALAALSGVAIFYELATPTTQTISPALTMTYRVEQGGTEEIIVPDGEVSAAPLITVAEPVNAGDEFARIWAAIQSLGYTRNATQLSRPVSLTDIGSVDEVQKDTTDVVEKEAAEIAEIDTVKEVQE